MAKKSNKNNTIRTKTSGTLRAPKGKKQDEGKTSQTGELSDSRVQVAPDAGKDRGIGSAFAFAVGAIMQKAAAMKGSQSDFLGEPSELIDPKQFAHSLIKGK